MRVERYKDQKNRWPASGRHILAQYDDENIIVYQAYRPSIGRYAAELQVFGGEFSFSRMSWIKPNFLWMMYRSGWGTKEGQEVVLAITLPRTLFDEMLAVAVPSTFTSALYPDQESWKKAVEASNVRLQWDPDHSPTGAAEERRAIQLGLRGDMLRRYGRDDVVAIEDISEFVAAQRAMALSRSDELMIPSEEVYYPKREDAWRSVGLQSTKLEQAGGEDV
ncbi:DUF4291 domain-containing protein [Verrucomicrobium sp. BvORR034]|uniref:DUF4291 family protein n=1 Tax=Verrucomicrobium sp. BvORR034 TaxID=1396418 RepID=UPI0006784E43